MSELSSTRSAVPTPFYRHVLVATGGAAHSEVAVQRAVMIVKEFGATLHIVSVVPRETGALLTAASAFPGGETISTQVWQDDYQIRAAYLKAAAEQLRAQGIDVVEHLQTALKPADAILEVAQQSGADLIVMGRKHKSAWSAALAGSVADMVSHASPVDVLIAR